MSLTTTQGKLQLLIATLVAAFVSFHWFSSRWYHLVIVGRAFPVWWGVLPTEYFVQSIPFTWPFAVAGFLLGPGIVTQRAPVSWLLLFGLLGSLSYGLLTEDAFNELRGTLSSHGFGVYTRACMPLFFELVGLLVARLRMEA